MSHFYVHFLKKFPLAPFYQLTEFGFSSSVFQIILVVVYIIIELSDGKLYETEGGKTRSHRDDNSWPVGVRWSSHTLTPEVLVELNRRSPVRVLI